MTTALLLPLFRYVSASAARFYFSVAYPSSPTWPFWIERSAADREYPGADGCVRSSLEQVRMGAHALEDQALALDFVNEQPVGLNVAVSPPSVVAD